MNNTFNNASITIILNNSTNITELNTTGMGAADNSTDSEDNSNNSSSLIILNNSTNITELNNTGPADNSTSNSSNPLPEDSTANSTGELPADNSTLNGNSSLPSPPVNSDNTTLNNSDSNPPENNSTANSTGELPADNSTSIPADNSTSNGSDSSGHLNPDNSTGHLNNPSSIAPVNSSDLSANGQNNDSYSAAIAESSLTGHEVYMINTTQTYESDGTPMNPGNQTINVALGQTFEIQLPGNPTTGYIWVFSNPISFGNYVNPLNLNSNDGTDNYVSNQSSGTFAGAGGFYYFRFDAIRRGINIGLDFRYQRTFQTGTANEVFVIINVE